MRSSVVSKITEQCRNALLGGISILYIKTDSSQLIRDVVYNWDDPLIVPICQSNDQYANRPVRELIKAGGNLDVKKILNIKNTLPNAMPQMCYPYLWYYKPTDQEMLSAWAELEKYVLLHENPSYPAYAKLQSSAVILYSSTVHLPDALQPYVEVIDVPYPEEDEIRDLILTESGAPSCMEGEYLNRLITLFHGFTTEEIVSTMQKIVALVPLDDTAKVEAQIRKRKEQRMEGGVLEFINDDGDIGGMNDFRAWLEKQKPALDDHVAYRRRIGTRPPKGVLLCGIPGCGKSEAAKFTAKELGLPLLKLDIGSLMDKYVGASEQRMRAALHLAESMAPCVLWIDELEKGFSNAKSESNDGGAFKRMFGYMLGWMQDVKVPVFIFATANDISGLPKEFFRSGRFDALYAVYLPTASECVSIFKSAMQRAVNTIAKALNIESEKAPLFEKSCFDDTRLAKLINTALVRPKKDPRIVIGSDIQKIVSIALRKLYGETPINAKCWFETLEAVLKDPAVALYGDSRENVDSIAVSYCRMLRKNFTPTANSVLFKPEDYNTQRLDEYARVLQQSTDRMTEEELKKRREKLQELQILHYNKPQTDSAYDLAVYECLHERINQMAVLLEQYERQQMIR